MFKRFSRPLQVLGVAAALSVAALGASAQGQAPAAGANPGTHESHARPGPDGRRPGPGPEGHRFGPGGPGHAPMFLGGRLLKEAGATEAQRKQIHEIFEAAHKDLKAQRQQGRQWHEQMESLLTAPAVDANAVEQLRQQMAAQHEAGSKRMSQALVEAAKVLTPEQRAKVAEALKKHRADMDKRMERMKERGGKGGPRGDRGPGGDRDGMQPPPPNGQ